MSSINIKEHKRSFWISDISYLDQEGISMGCLKCGRNVYFLMTSIDHLKDALRCISRGKNQ